MVLLARSQQDHLAGASVAIGISLLAWVVTVFALLVIHEQTLLANPTWMILGIPPMWSIMITALQPSLTDAILLIPISITPFSWKLVIVMPASFEYKREMGGKFPSPEKYEVPRPLPEDYTMRGLIHPEDHNPGILLTNGKIDEEENYTEPTPLAGQRKERMLYLEYKIAPQDQWLTCAPAHVTFSLMNQML
ncbi:hypothetical protein BGZ61DRAFT_533902 [Ilyonectria robusta]|uniref:uncharacterized protein n=1 Tax=Ilyonectria robusta TaxID=1079257 RepID=UPI001E8CF362|nr:uncharacterized protein BGZ61DRAFT_533902 [Ilyonectria robusta]KAH8686357.1 hypothetical protein BGZ61DRAFT_533902 [Ilyonectria robusta]